MAFYLFTHTNTHTNLKYRAHTLNCVAKITREQIQALDEEETEVYEAMKDLAALDTPYIALLKREMKRRGRSERSTNQIIETLSLLGKIMLGAGDLEGRFEITRV